MKYKPPHLVAIFFGLFVLGGGGGGLGPPSGSATGCNIYTSSMEESGRSTISAIRNHLKI